MTILEEKIKKKKDLEIFIHIVYYFVCFQGRNSYSLWPKVKNDD